MSKSLAANPLRRNGVECFPFSLSICRPIYYLQVTCRRDSISSKLASRKSFYCGWKISTLFGFRIKFTLTFDEILLQLQIAASENISSRRNSRYNVLESRKCHFPHISLEFVIIKWYCDVKWPKQSVKIHLSHSHFRFHFIHSVVQFNLVAPPLICLSLPHITHCTGVHLWVVVHMRSTCCALQER